MEIYCNKCDRVLGHYPDEKIPLNVRGHTTCKLCGSTIEIFRTGEEAPPEAVSALPNGESSEPEAVVDDAGVPEWPDDNLSEPEDHLDDASRPEALVEASNPVDELVKTIPLLSGRMDGGVKRADFMFLGIGLLILFAIIFIYKPDLDPSKIFPKGMQDEFAAEMMNGGQGKEDEPVESVPDMEGLEEVEDAVNVIDETGKM